MDFKTFLNEAPLPDDWDKQMFKPKSFKSMVEYAKERAERLGAGSARVAFEIEYQGRPTVLKVAKNKKGVVQNVTEVEYLDDGFIGDLDCVIKLIDYDEENGDDGVSWIHTEKAEKVKKSDFVKETNVDLDELVAFCFYVVTGRKIRYFDMDDLKDKINHDSYLTSSLIDLFHGAEGLLPSDLMRIANWGKFKDKLVIIDLGFSETSSKLYRL